MLDLNTKCDEISDKLSSGADIDALEKDYSCEIVLLSDDNYESVNNFFIKEDMSVFDYMEDGVIKGKIAFNARSDEHEALVRNSQSQLITMLALIYAAGMILLVIIWYFYIRPFKKLSSFAANVSKGNLDTPLNMDKHNYFGAFTESFDRMREELKLSSEREAAANRSKQELVAELSHDIKTPVATIKATCEVMDIKYKEPDVQEKVAVIKSKASSVEQLVDNMSGLGNKDMLKIQMDCVRTTLESNRNRHGLKIIFIHEEYCVLVCKSISCFDNPFEELLTKFTVPFIMCVSTQPTNRTAYLKTQTSGL